MTAFNTARIRVKPGRENEFIEHHRKVGLSAPGLRHASIFKTGDHTFCIIGEWDDMASIVAARPTMIATLDTFRDMLEDLGGGLGVTDPVSGEVVLKLK